MTNFEKFCTIYAEQFKKAVTEHPDEYYFPMLDFPKVTARMKQAFAKGSYNKDGRAIKATCKILEIKHTYAEINKFLRS